MGLDSILLILGIMCLFIWYIVVPHSKFKRQQAQFSDYPSPKGPVTITRSAEPPVIEMRMPNGAIDWAETHHEIVSFIEMRLGYQYDYCPIHDYHNQFGTGGIYELGIKWTDEFEDSHVGIEWGVEMEWHDEIEKFLSKKVEK